MAILSLFDRKASKVEGFVTACKLYLKMRMREMTVKEQVQQVLTYVQEEAVDIWKENMMENLEAEMSGFKTVREFLEEIKKEF